MTPRILFLDQSGALGGAELYLLDVARAFRATSRVLLFDDGPFRDRLAGAHISVRVAHAGAALHQVRKRGAVGAALRVVPALVQLVRTVAREAQAYDVIVANTQKALLVGALAGWWSDRPVVWNLHDLLTADHFTLLHRTLAVQAANWGTVRVIANSEASKQAFRAAGGRTPVQVVYNGIDPAPFDAVTDAEATACRAQLGLPAHAPVVGVFSRLAEWKGQHVLVDALRDVPEAHALLVGDALFGGDTSYRDVLQARIRAHGLSERVHLLGFRDDIPTLMKACDIIAHTSVQAEPFGRVIVEGMLANRPVVATAAGGALEIVDDAQTGWLVPPNDAHALADRLQCIVAHPRAAAQVAARGQAHARHAFSIERMVQGVRRSLPGPATGDRLRLVLQDAPAHPAPPRRQRTAQSD
ncbi:glycosyltransferase family 4 protein [Salisaeta longa]|uniref:glycosyltransferase family 4 protein n=1 Tax=Salisaeta longa TaxID=503170 RepID=UPI0003B327D4|nr:glycosyltransferase family 4 protein [Salisaeta longa]